VALEPLLAAGSTLGRPSGSDLDAKTPLWRVLSSGEQQQKGFNKLCCDYDCQASRQQLYAVS
jgi:hypothetical protein